MKNLIISKYKKLLNRNPTDYELFIYSEAMRSGFRIEQVENIILTSSEYNYIKNIKKNILSNNNLKNKNIKVALCLSGHIRNFDYIKFDLLKNILNNFNTDVFFHTWNTDGFQKKSDNNIGIEYSESENKKIDSVINFLKPKKYLIENHKIISKDFKVPDVYYVYGAPVNTYGTVNSTAKPINIISQFYSIKKSFELLQSYQNNNLINYDLIIKSRFDFKFDSPIPLEEIGKVNDFNIFVLDKNYSASNFDVCNLCKDNKEHDIHHDFVNDIVLFGNQKVMSNYFQLYDKYYDIYNNMINMCDLNVSNKNICFSSHGINFIGNISDAKDISPCFFPENILRHLLSKFKINGSKINGYVFR